MTTIEVIPTGENLGATIAGIDLSKPLGKQAFGDILRALGRYGVLRFPKQRLDPAQQMAFSARFGSLSRDHDPVEYDRAER